MWEIIVGCLLCIFAAIGIAHFMRTLIFCFFKGNKAKSYVIIDPDTNREDLEYTLLNWEAKCGFLREKSLQNIIILDKGLSEEDKRLCRLFTKEKEIFKVCTVDEILKILTT